MAKHDVTSQMQELAKLGYDRDTVEKLATTRGATLYIWSGGAEAFGRKSEGIIDSLVDEARSKAQKAATGATPAAETKASQRQVDYIMSLIQRRIITGDASGFMYGPTDRAGVAQLTRAEASTYIDSLTGNY